MDVHVKLHREHDHDEGRSAVGPSPLVLLYAATAHAIAVGIRWRIQLTLGYLLLSADLFVIYSKPLEVLVEALWNILLYG